MDTTRIEQIETVIIGAGQAGLATGYHLQRRGRPFVILDAGSRIGDNWRRQWDTLKLYSPAKYDSLPGLPFPAKPWSFPGKDQVGDYLESYAADVRPPGPARHARPETSRRTATATVVTTDHGTCRCDNVVVATGTFGRTPNVPDVADQLDPSILQLHSSEYRRPGQLRDGPVLVVGASHSGTRHRLRGRRDATDDPGRPRLRADPAAARVAVDARDLPGADLRVAARAHPPYADRPQGDARGPLRTAARCCG